MFKRLPSPEIGEVTLHIEDRLVTVPAGTSVAAAVLSANCLPCRESVVSQAPRGPYCMMGLCFECLMEVDGRANCQTCLLQARDGMVVRRQSGLAKLPKLAKDP